MPSTSTALISDAQLASELRGVVVRLTRRIRAQRVNTSLSLSQISALATLEAHGPLTAREIASHEQVQPPTMTKILAALSDRDLITRTANPDDRRSTMLAATSAGRAVVEVERRARDRWLAAQLTELDPAERELLQVLMPILDHIGANP